VCRPITHYLAGEADLATIDRGESSFPTTIYYDALVQRRQWQQRISQLRQDYAGDTSGDCENFVVVVVGGVSE